MESAPQSEPARAPQPKEPTPQHSPALRHSNRFRRQEAEELHPDRPDCHSLTLPLMRTPSPTARASPLLLEILLGACLRLLDREICQEDCLGDHQEDCQED